MQAQAVMSILLIGALLLILYGPWRETATDWARQIVFEKRDAIFDLAHEGKLSFESAEYRTIRLSLERSIRFAHELTAWRFAILAAGLAQTGELHEKSGLRQAIEAIADPDARREVDRLVSGAQKATILMMVFKSPLIMGVTILILPWLLIQSLAAKFRKQLRRAGEIAQVEAEAVAEGKLKAA